MEILKISIINIELEKLGINEDDNYADFHFNAKDLIGYWIAQGNGEETSDEIIVYIGAHKFVSPYEKETISRLNEMLSKNSKL